MGVSLSIYVSLIVISFCSIIPYYHLYLYCWDRGIKEREGAGNRDERERAQEKRETNNNAERGKRRGREEERIEEKNFAVKILTIAMNRYSFKTIYSYI